MGALDEVGDIHWHLVDLGVVEGFDVMQYPLVVVRDEVDGDALAAEPTSTSDSEIRKVLVSVIRAVEIGPTGGIICYRKLGTAPENIRLHVLWPRTESESSSSALKVWQSCLDTEGRCDYND